MIPQAFLDANYLNLVTFRKSGDAVKTPVWFCHDDTNLYILSAGEAGKVKRLRNSSRAEIAPCTYSGKVTGEWIPATATLISEPEEIKHALQCFDKKYGWQMRSFNFFSSLGGRINKRAYIRVTVAK